MIEGTLFIGLVIIAVTEAIKRLAPQVQGLLTMLVSVGVGIVVALIDVYIGVGDMSIAQGIVAGLAASGTVSVAKAVSSQAPPKDV